MTVSLLIMTLNEIDGMKKLMPKINPDWVDEIILVDGGSTDGTIQEAEKYGLKILHQQKKGHGAGILEGIESTSSDFVVIWAPDGNHEPEEIPLLIEKSKEGFDQVIISRFGNGSINDDANLAFAVMVSVLALPRVVLPLTDKLSVTVKSLPIVTSSRTQIRTRIYDTVDEISIECAAKVTVSVPIVN